MGRRLGVCIRPGAGGTDGRPDRQGEDDDDRRRRPGEQHERVEDKPEGRLGESRLTDGSEGGESEGQQDASEGSHHADEQRPGHAECHQPTTGETESAQRGERVGLDRGLAGQRLGDDDHADQRGQTGQDPPPDGLGMDGQLDRLGIRIEVGHRQRAERPDTCLEAGEIRLAMPEPNEVGVDSD